jgi:hypothetical protein
MKAPAILLLPAAAGLIVLGTCMGVGMTQAMNYSQPIASDEEPSVVVEETPTPTPTPSESALAPLPPCEYEDSENCFWDAGEAGNGEGTSFVDIDGTPYYPEPVTEPEKGPSESAPAPWVQPCTTWLADHGGVCMGEPIDWEFSSGETLVCGHDAKPALDYREDVGWWAYCEPALVP